MPLPTFFVIGAPKSGSTALYDALAQHPDIFMSPVKEPLYFACDGEPGVHPGPCGTLMRRRAIWRSAEYLALFAGARGERAIGEASVLYLRSPLAAARIHRNLPDSRLIAILRQPAERAHSHFWFSVANGSEPARRFETALDDEVAGRRQGWTSELHHWRNGFYHEQLKRYVDLFGRDRILVCSYEHWNLSPHAVLQEIFRFLDVDDRYRPDIRRLNTTHTRPRQGLSVFRKKAVPPLHRATREWLTQSYRDDILRLETLIDQDLSAWFAK